MIRSIATATFVATIVLAGPALAASPATRHVTARSHSAAADDVETRIKTLHDQLKIKPEQQQAFNNVAEVMRANANAMKELRAKVQQPASANALEQLNSYAAVVDAHSEGVHKFIPAFQTLYDSMSDQQKKTADAVLRTRVKEAARRQGR